MQVGDTAKATVAFTRRLRAQHSALRSVQVNSFLCTFLSHYHFIRYCSGPKRQKKNLLRQANTCRKPTQWGRRSSVALTTSTMAAREDSWTWGVDIGAFMRERFPANTEMQLSVPQTKRKLSPQEERRHQPFPRLTKNAALVIEKPVTLVLDKILFESIPLSTYKLCSIVLYAHSISVTQSLLSCGTTVITVCVELWTLNTVP